MSRAWNIKSSTFQRKEDHLSCTREESLAKVLSSTSSYYELDKSVLEDFVPGMFLLKSKMYTPDRVGEGGGEDKKKKKKD